MSKHIGVYSRTELLVDLEINRCFDCPCFEYSEGYGSYCMIFDLDSNEENTKIYHEHFQELFQDEGFPIFCPLND